MARLSGKVEQVIFPLYEVLHRKRVADIADVDVDPIPEIGDVGQIASVLRNEAVDQCNVCTLQS